MPERERKSLRTVEIKDGEKGIITAAFAKMGVMDLDGDIILPGAFGKQKVAMSAFGHNSWEGGLPIGKGSISEKGGEAVAELKLFMSTETGREHLEVIKGMGDLQEWSFGFDVKETGEVTEELRQQGVRRVLKSLKVHEVSPVLRGAGIDTRTTSVKKDEGSTKVETTVLGALLKTLMDENELSNGDLGKALGCHAVIAGQLVDGTTKQRPSLSRLEKAAEVLKTSLSRLRAAAEADGHDFTDEDEMRTRGAAANEASTAALKALELTKSAETEARAAVEAKTASEAAEAHERLKVYQAEAQSEYDRLSRNMERYQA